MDIITIVSLLIAPFIILICAGELLLIIWAILKSLGYLNTFVIRLAKKNGTRIFNILNKEKQRLTAPLSKNQQQMYQIISILSSEGLYPDTQA